SIFKSDKEKSTFVLKNLTLEGK
ncbi:TPA: DUF4492 domain-containing protein, partial [Campylobacter jejuni]|nr:DUF4492 domain-containing protein [Campylobacter jejuni]